MKGLDHPDLATVAPHIITNEYSEHPNSSETPSLVYVHVYILFINICEYTHIHTFSPITSIVFCKLLGLHEDIICY